MATTDVKLTVRVTGIERLVRGLEIMYDENVDVVEIEGVKYAADLFRALGSNGLDVGAHLRILSRADGVVTLQRIYAEDGDGGERAADA